MSASPCRFFSGASPRRQPPSTSPQAPPRTVENELGEARLAAKGPTGRASEPTINADMLGNIEEYGQEEIDEPRRLISTGANGRDSRTARRSQTLKGLETMALGVLRSGVDTKWSQLNRILDDDLMVGAAGNRRKLIISPSPRTR